MEQLARSEMQHSSGFLLGALVGAGVALLFAPQSGAEIRRLLRDYAVRAKEELGDNVDRGAEALDSAVERGHELAEKVHEVGRQAKTYVETGTKVAQDIKDELTSQPR